ncbi:hypothetical protein EDB19DRAFT_1830470 [Suillus lakei]|nr:hypothetical protein EDB19DRAFT_1830470 [Suillus lakei]
MARTKNTAKKSNGGSAPRVILNFPRASGASGVERQRREVLTSSKASTVGGGDVEKRNARHKALTGTKPTLPMAGGHNEFCILCRDGADRYEDNTLFMCGLCPRVLPPDLETSVLQEDISFRCVCCHIKMDQPGAYFGFYHTNGVPVLDRFLPINGALEVSERAEISAAPVLFVHLSLVDFAVSGSPLEFAHTFLKPYYSGAGINYIDVVYDIGTDEKLAPYRAQVRKMIKGLKNSFVWERVVFGISTHTDEDFGDPFIGYEDSKEYHSTGVNDFLEIILDPWQGIIDHAQESYLWMLCCGSLVNNKDSFQGLQEAVVRHKLTGTIAFNAPRFQPSFASHLLLSFTERVLIGRCPLRLAFKDMLAQACDLGRHSDVFLLTTDKEGALTCSSGCGWANSWRSAYVKGSKDKSYIFECKNDSCNPPGSTVLYSGRKNGGTWLDIPLETEFA